MCQKLGWCVWVTGVPGSGKSVISHALLEKLKAEGINAQILSSDMLRKVVTPKPSYSLEERDIVYATLVLIAKLLTENSVNVIIDATGNLRRYRDKARKQIPRFIEAYIQCPLDICIERESKRVLTFYAPKDIYKKGATGKSLAVPGLGAPYELPLKPEVTVTSERLGPEKCAQKILETLTEKFQL
jgi:adenylylsulfate kinase